MRKTSVLVLVALLTLVSVQAFAFEAPPTFLRKWGSYGSDKGQFNSPNGVAVDKDGNVYVADTGNRRIQKFDRYGNWLLMWGSYGSGNGQFEEPYGVAVDKDGNVYVADGNYSQTDGLVSSRIQKFDSNGTFLLKWGSYGSGDGQFREPRGVAVDTAGNVYVADTHNYRIQKFATDGTFLEWGRKGSEDGQFDFPYDVAVDKDGNVYVADSISNNRIQKFASDGTFLLKWGSHGSSDGMFNFPNGVAVDMLGNVYVADNLNSRIQKFDGAGTFLVKWGGTFGAGDGQFRAPNGVAVDVLGNVYVADTENDRIQVFEDVNDPPVLDPIGAQSVPEGTELTFTATASDPDLPVNTLTFSLDGAPEGASIAGSTGAFSWTPTEAQGPGDPTFTVKVCDDGDPSLCDEEEITVTVNEVNESPELDPIGAKTVDEGTELTFTATASDPDLPANTLTFSLVGAPEGASIAGSTGAFSWTPTEAQGPGSYTLNVCVTDDGLPSLSDCETIQVTVNEVPVNQTPTADAGGPYLVAVGGQILLDGSASSDPDGDPLAEEWAADGGMVSGDSYTAGPVAGIYDVQLIVNDDQTDSQPDKTFVVVYDPGAGFVTGGGWINSPGGAYTQDSDLSGKATFGFVSKYKKGASAPEGNTEFQFQAGGFSFHSAAYQWLVVDKAGTNAQFKGSGTVNGELDSYGNEFKFMIWATDSTPDSFRIRIWWEDAAEHVVYDNGFDQSIGGGSIVVHTK
jgi:DNA-binding beta-propeller fold protein YncE